MASIALSGMNRAAPYVVGEQAAAQELVNLRYKDGAWRAAGDKLLMNDNLLDGTTNVFTHLITIHHTADGSDILLLPSPTALYYCNLNDTTTKSSIAVSITTDSTIYGFNNILLIDDKYLLYRDGTYSTPLTIDMPDITFRASTAMKSPTIESTNLSQYSVTLNVQNSTEYYLDERTSAANYKYELK